MKVRRHAWPGLGLALVVSCSRPGPGALDRDAGEQAALEEGRPEARSITSDQVEAYVRYRRALGHVPPRERARADTRAMRDAGLSEETLDAVEPVVLEVMGRLQLVKVSQVEETLATYEKVMAALPADQQQTLQPTLTTLRARRDTLQSLLAARQRYGNAAVEAVLAHQTELKGLAAPGK